MSIEGPASQPYNSMSIQQPAAVPSLRIAAGVVAIVLFIPGLSMAEARLFTGGLGGSTPFNGWMIFLLSGGCRFPSHRDRRHRQAAQGQRGDAVACRNFYWFGCRSVPWSASGARVAGAHPDYPSGSPRGIGTRCACHRHGTVAAIVPSMICPRIVSPARHVPAGQCLV